MPGALNIFQRAMLQWNDLQPYNAVHVVRLAAQLEPERLRHIIEHNLLRRGIASLTLDRRRGIYEYQAPTVGTELPTGSYSETALAAALVREINTPFNTNGPFCPVRFFVLSEPQSFILGAAYFHPVADAESLVFLLKGIVSEYLNPEHSPPVPAFDVYPVRHDRIWWSRPALTIRRMLALPAELRATRRSRRLHVRDPDDLSNGCSPVTLDEKAVAVLLTRARAWNVTVHDLLLAVLMKSVTAVMPIRDETTRRCNLAIGSIVNIRADCAINRERTFGLFLGSFFVSHRVPPGISLQDLGTDLRRQTARIKQQKTYLATPLQLLIAGALFSLYSTRRRKLFYHRFHPLGGGISNMSLDGYWKNDERGRPMDYFRAVSTGPITPLVVSATTYQRKMTLAISYQTSVFSPPIIADLQEHLCGQIKDLDV